jgi:hypothetical protein
MICNGPDPDQDSSKWLDPKYGNTVPVDINALLIATVPYSVGVVACNSYHTTRIKGPDAGAGILIVLSRLSG